MLKIPLETAVQAWRDRNKTQFSEHVMAALSRIFEIKTLPLVYFLTKKLQKAPKKYENFANF